MDFNRSAVILIFCLAMLAGCAGREKGENKLVRKVKVEEVQQADSLLQKSYSGVIKEKCRVDMAFRVAGPILNMEVDEGDFVEKGQFIARLDPRDYEIQLEAARAQYEQVKSETERVVELHERKSVAENKFDKARTGEKMAAAKVENAKDRLNDTRLLAPVSGFVQKVNFAAGEMVDAGMPVVSLLNVANYEVEVEIPVSLFVKKDKFRSFSGRQPVVTTQALPLQMMGYSKKASNNQLYKLHLKLDPALEPKLAPGMDLQVEIIYESGNGSMMWVPMNAVFEKDRKSFVWIYHPEQGVVKSREVISSQLTGDGRIQITGGLEGNEKIVVAGVHLLRENQEVEVLKPASETNVGGLL